MAACCSVPRVPVIGNLQKDIFSLYFCYVMEMIKVMKMSLKI